ncbi:MAG TPA: transglutaminase-like domain-containing protein [Chitinophagales bacterium]|nr:transglutaminase-like domain-containing protein [Chitinophagales bacterium]
MNKNEINALISLLDDPDEGIFKHVSSKFLSLGQEIIPVLEDAWEHSFDTLIQNRIENIIHQIQFDIIKADLKKWAHPDRQNLLEGALLIARYQYPDIDASRIKKQINQIKHDVWLELNENLTGLEKVKIINHILFDVHNFSGNTTNYHAPQNSYINNVLESKKGNPLLLSIIYTIIAQNLDIPIYGVNLPEHFILCYMDVEHMGVPTQEGNEGGNVLFYINPFSKGAVFGSKEIDAFLKQLNLSPMALFYEPCSNLEIIKRLMRNLISSYEKLGYPDKSDELRELLQSLG